MKKGDLIFLKHGSVLLVLSDPYPCHVRHCCPNEWCLDRTLALMVVCTGQHSPFASLHCTQEFEPYVISP